MNPHLRESLGLLDNTPIKFWLRYWNESVSDFTRLDNYAEHSVLLHLKTGILRRFILGHYAKKCYKVLMKNMLTQLLTS